MQDSLNWFAIVAIVHDIQRSVCCGIDATTPRAFKFKLPIPEQSTENS